MLASYPPFYDEDPMKTYAKIMQGTINFPSHFSKEAVSIIKKLLQHKPTKRLGVVNGGAAEIKKVRPKDAHSDQRGRAVGGRSTTRWDARASGRHCRGRRANRAIVARAWANASV